jgi:type VI secretion system secreted protein VgrG
LTSPLTVTTPLGPDALFLRGLTGTDPLSRLFRFQLDMVAENDRAIPFEDIVGQPASVSLALPGGGKRYFHGICSRVSQGRRGGTFTAYGAEVVPRLWLLTRKQNSRIFQQLSVPQILERVLGGLDLTLQLQRTYPPREFCVQYRETDLDFASRLMEEEGIFYFFEHSATGHQMVLADTPASHPEVPGPDPVQFAVVPPSRPGTKTVFQWEKTQELGSGKVTLWDHQFELPHDHLEGSAVIQDTVRVGAVTHHLRVGGNDSLEIYDFPGGYAKRFDGVDPEGGDQSAGLLQETLLAAARTAGTRMQEEAVPALLVEGMSNCRHFTGGHRFTLDGHFDGDGRYVLTGVEHSASVSGDPRTATQTDLDYHNEFTCIPIGLTFRPPRATPVPVIPGLQSAVVVGPAGQTTFTDKFGRVKVQFHWDRQGVGDEHSSVWVRVGAMHAGEETGFHVAPEIGDEVLVGFLEGDPDQPVIVGSVWNPDHPPPGRGAEA